MHSKKRAWVVAVDMGYGHERAAFALKELANHHGVITANNYVGIPESDVRMWRQSRRIYETISRLQATPVVGPYIFEILDRFQQIPLFYPRRDLSAPNLQLKEMYHLIRKKGLCKHLIERLAKDPAPLITTFFLTAFAADEFNYPGDIYCVATDADISRTWAPLDPKRSRIKYIAPNGRVVERLKLYGVPEHQIFLTGFPLPRELVGGPNADIVKEDFGRRLLNLDPHRIFTSRHEKTLRHHLGAHYPKKPHHPLTLTFAVGGAGAQRALGKTILESLRGRILRHEIRLTLVAGVRPEVAAYFRDAIRALRFPARDIGTWVRILFAPSRAAYFTDFTDLLHETDILWTKPSELSFYTGLGIPILMAPPVGSQEEFNELWLRTVGGGVPQNDPRYTDEWLFDWVESGGLARMAWNGYIEAPTHGAYRVEEIVRGKSYKLASLPLIV